MNAKAAVASFLSLFRRFRAALWSAALLLAAARPALADIYVPAISESDQTSVLFFGLLIGIVLAAGAYLFFIWIVMRDRGQVSLILFLLSIGLNIFVINDMLMHHLGIFGTLHMFLTNLSVIISWVFALFFTYYFLDLESNAPGYKTPFIIIGSLLMCVLLYSVIDPSADGRAFVYLIMPPIGTIVLSGILIAGLSGVRSGTSGSVVHIMAFICYLGGILAEPSYILGYLQTAMDAHNATYISFALSAMIFSVVVSSQFAARQDEKEKALAISNERFMLATRGANEGLFDWNLVTGEIFFSDQFRRILGFRIPNSAKGLKKWIRMIQQPYRRHVVETVRRFRHNAKANTLNVEYCIKQVGGEPRWLHSKAVAVRDRTTQKIMRLVGSTSDITERKKSEFALLASEARFRSITEAHPVPVLIIGLATGEIFYATPGAVQLTGIRQDDFRRADLERLMPDSAVRRQIVASVAAGVPVDLVETEIRRKEGPPIPAAISARAITFQDQAAMVMGIYDLTESKKAEARIAQQQEALQQSEKMAALGGLLAGVAHELNNPLSVVVGQSTLLMEGAPEAKVASRAEKIFKAADRCSRIVKSFLALARRKPPERKKVDVNQIMHASLELLGYQLKTSDITVDSDLDSRVCEVIGDSDQLTQVFTNLILNAAQAMEGWKGKHHITVTSRRERDGKVLVTIADTGPGIPADIRTRIFEPFFTTKGGKGGTGVGLALCLNIVSAHGGDLLLTDTFGGGATFTVKFPSADEVNLGDSGTKDGAEIALKPSSVLLVDDEIELAQTLADLLEPEGLKTDIALNGAIAMDKLRQHKFDAIISDLRMPVMDGPALYEALERELPSYLNRIIYVTGDTLSSHVHDFLNAHAVPVVEKPYRLKDIRRALSELLKNAAQAKGI